jgi:transposase InsO family protein
MKNRIAISMTQNGSPYENALAECMNGIIKSEFIPRKLYRNHVEAKMAIDGIITTYNSQRPHTSLNYLTPEIAYTAEGAIRKRWKTYNRST